MLMRSRPLVCSIASFCSFGAQQPTGRAAWVGCTASTNIATSSSPLEFRSDVDALAPARLFDRELLFLRGPATHGPRRVGGMHRVHEYRDLVVALGIQQVFVARDKRLLRFGV